MQLLRPVCRKLSGELTKLCSLGWCQKSDTNGSSIGYSELRYLFVVTINDSLNLFAPTAETIGQHIPMIFVANVGRNDLSFESGFWALYHGIKYQ